MSADVQFRRSPALHWFEWDMYSRWHAIQWERAFSLIRSSQTSACNHFKRIVKKTPPPPGPPSGSNASGVFESFAVATKWTHMLTDSRLEIVRSSMQNQKPLSNFQGGNPLLVPFQISGHGPSRELNRSAAGTSEVPSKDLASLGVCPGSLQSVTAQ